MAMPLHEKRSVLQSWLGPPRHHAQNAGKTTGRATCSDAPRRNRFGHVKALRAVQTLALRVAADRLEQGEPVREAMLSTFRIAL